MVELQRLKICGYFVFTAIKEQVTRFSANATWREGRSLLNIDFECKYRMSKVAKCQPGIRDLNKYAIEPWLDRENGFFIRKVARGRRQTNLYDVETISLFGSMSMGEF